ncbi:hypothetical protein PG997_010789 [Apiospora hydei]|uniref:Uncharacterized protein n=1 Tax=Apiospora hydei TaxID=1337664 RepID=A0ABR1VH63_9PEZI
MTAVRTSTSRVWVKPFLLCAKDTAQSAIRSWSKATKMKGTERPPDMPAAKIGRTRVSYASNTTLLLTGCTSTSLRNIYLISLSYNSKPLSETSEPLSYNHQISQFFLEQVQSSDYTIKEVRIGYTWVSPGRAVASAANSDPLNLVQIAHSVRTGTMFYPLMVLATMILAGVTVLMNIFPNCDNEEGEDSQGSEREINIGYGLKITRAIMASVWLLCPGSTSVVPALRLLWKT